MYTEKLVTDGDAKKKLIKAAIEAVSDSHAPYSHFNVGAAALFSSGEIYAGVNVENASYGLSICAERNAVFQAAAKGERKLLAIAIAGGREGVIKDYCSPCGACRQVMREFGDPKSILVIMAKSETDYIEKTLEELLPMSFGPDLL